MKTVILWSIKGEIIRGATFIHIEVNERGEFVLSGPLFDKMLRHPSNGVALQLIGKFESVAIREG